MFEEFPVMIDSHRIVDAIKSIEEPFEFDLNNNDSVLRNLYTDMELSPCP